MSVLGVRCLHPRQTNREQGSNRGLDRTFLSEYQFTPRKSLTTFLDLITGRLRSGLPFYSTPVMTLSRDTSRLHSITVTSLLNSTRRTGSLRLRLQNLSLPKSSSLTSDTRSGQSCHPHSPRDLTLTKDTPDVTRPGCRDRRHQSQASPRQPSDRNLRSLGQEVYQTNICRITYTDGATT